uniref:Uncharacterized protein n=1 Tax=Arundo donax TaxID=35708 RepID=A0A0A9G1H5_ARUDO
MCSYPVGWLSARWSNGGQHAGCSSSTCAPAVSHFGPFRFMAYKKYKLLQFFSGRYWEIRCARYGRYQKVPNRRLTFCRELLVLP